MDNSTQKTRQRILHQIGVIFPILPPPEITSSTIRILGDIPNSILNPSNYLESIHPFISATEESLKNLHPNSKTLLIAAKIYRGKHSYFILDLNNRDYGYETANECKALIPVYVIRLSKRQPTIYLRRVLDEPIAKIFRNMHNLMVRIRYLCLIIIMMRICNTRIRAGRNGSFEVDGFAIFFWGTFDVNREWCCLMQLC